MQISRNIVNGPKTIKWVMVGIRVIVCILKASQHFLQTFSPLRMFKIVLRDSSLYPKQLPLFFLLWLICPSADPIGFISNFCSMVKPLHELKNCSCQHRRIQAFDNVSARKKENQTFTGLPRP